MNPQEFKAKHGYTLHTDPETQKHYIKLPIDDLNELIYMQVSLLDGIILLTQLEERYYKNEQIQSVMYWLCKLVLLSYPHEELSGISKLLKAE